MSVAKCWLACLVLAHAAVAGAQQTELARVAGDTESLGTKIQALAQAYEKPEILAGVRSFSSRLTDAEILFLLRDFSRASLVLYDLVNNPDYERESLYPQAIYYLAESLFEIRQDLSSRFYFSKLIEMGNRQYLKNAVRRLIQIADRLERWDGLESNIAALSKEGPLPPDIAYIRAKSLVRQGKFDAAISEAKSVPEIHRLSPKAAYLTAVASLQKGDAVSALATFEKLKQVNETYDDAAMIRELSAMNQGRILLEQGKTGESVDAYQFVSRNSSLFEQALYESTWSFVRSAESLADMNQKRVEYKKAMNALEILLLSESETDLTPESRLLLGNIQIRLGDLEKAALSFDDVVQRYGSAETALRRLAQQGMEPKRYFEEISRDANTPGVLPALSLKWAKNTKRLQKAMVVASDVDEGEKWINDSNELITRLLKALELNKKTSLLPTLQEAQTRLIEVDNTMMALSRRLLEVERGLTKPYLTDVENRELQAISTERQQLEPEFLKLPQRREEYEKRVDEMRKRMAMFEQQAFRLKYELSSMQAQLKALEIWLASHPDLAATENSVREPIEQQRAVVHELEKLQKDLERDIATEKALISVANATEARENEVRARYAAILERERQMLVPALAKVDAQTMKALEEQRTKLGAYKVEIDRFRKKIEGAIESRSTDIKAQVLRAQGELVAQTTALMELRDQTQEVVGEVANASLKEVATRFQDLLLRANVGIIDVAWAQKETQTSKVNLQVEEQKKYLQLLDNDFKEVLEQN